MLLVILQHWEKANLTLGDLRKLHKGSKISTES